MKRSYEINSKLLLSGLILGVLVFPGLVSRAAPAITWGDANGYAYSKILSANMSGISGNLVNFPARVHLNASNFNFSLVQPDLDDIRFLAMDDKTVLNAEKASYDSEGHTAEFWVSCNWTANANNSDYIKMYYGNPKAKSNWNTRKVWAEAGALGVYHFDGYSNNLTANSAGELKNSAQVFGGLPEWADAGGGEPVYQAGGLGSVLKIGSTYYLYYDNTYGGQAISIATSPDGIHWTYAAGLSPALVAGPKGSWDSYHIGIPYVFEDDGTYYMTYRGNNSSANNRKGGLAYSSDGIHWTKSSNNPFLVGDDSWIAPGLGVEPWGVIKVGDTYYNYYSGFGLQRRIGVQTTTDSPSDWNTAGFTKYPLNPIFGDYMRCMDIFTCGGYYYALPTYRTSESGPSSIRLYRATNPMFTDAQLIRTVKRGSSPWDSFFLDTAYILTENINRNSFPDNRIFMYHAGTQTSNVYKLGLTIEDNVTKAIAPFGEQPSSVTKSSVNLYTAISVPGEYVDLKQTFSAIAGSTNKTLLAWACSNTDNYTTEADVINTQRTAGASAFTLRAFGTPAHWRISYAVGNTLNHLDSVSALDVGKKTFLAATINGTAVRLQVDSKVARADDGGIPTVGAPLDAAVGVLFYPSSVPTNFLNGSVDEVRVYNRTLSPAELQADNKNMLNTLITVHSLSEFISIKSDETSSGADIGGTIIMPEIATGAVTGVTANSNSVILNGNVSSMGSAANAYVSFQWGSPAYEHSTPEQVVSGTGNFSAAITGLTEGMTLHNRAIVRVGSVLSYGKDVTAVISSKTDSHVSPAKNRPGISALIIAGSSFLLLMIAGIILLNARRRIIVHGRDK